MGRDRPRVMVNSEAIDTPDAEANAEKNVAQQRAHLCSIAACPVQLLQHSVASFRCSRCQILHALRKRCCTIPRGADSRGRSRVVVSAVAPASARSCRPREVGLGGRAPRHPSAQYRHADSLAHDTVCFACLCAVCGELCGLSHQSECSEKVLKRREPQKPRRQRRMPHSAHRDAHP